MQIKTTMRYHYILIKMVKIQNTDNTKWRECKIIGALIQWECKMAQTVWKAIWLFLTKRNTLLSYNPAVKLLGIYSNELKLTAI